MTEADSKDRSISALCYVSKARDKFSREELDDLVRQASDFNYRNHITGFLCKHNEQFLQYLEGDAEVIHTLLQRIEKDTRHHILNTVVLNKPEARRYADWSMMRINPNSRGINSLIETIMNIAVDELTDPVLQDTAQSTLLTLLDCLGEDSMRENIEADFVGKKIIAIGASAGGINPIKSILASLPKDIDASIILVLHLSPSHKTVLDEILQRDTGFPVELAKDNDLLLPGRVNLIPPSKNIKVRAGRILVTDQYPRQDVDSGSAHIQHPVDVLFSNLARQHGKKVIGVILSGSGNDGARGSKHLREAGAIVIAQDPENADFEGMPSAAISAGAIDRVLPLDEIGQFISGLLETHAESSNAPLSGRDIETIEDILILLASHGIDFTGYKRQTVNNRVLRRKSLIDARTLLEYHELLVSSAKERELLKNDLLICVTEFFRDKPAWESLAHKVEHQLLEQLDEDDVLRVWIPGCATGEEAYTMAIMLSEVLDRSGATNDFKIFATDLSDSSLDFAAAGIYKCSSIRGFTDEQLQKYFHPYNDGYQVSSLIKEKVIFNQHNMIKDAPFSNMHLVCCRNVIIYMDIELQNRVLRILHFALVKNGILFLGPSESTGVLAKEFNTQNREWNIHTRNNDRKVPLHLDAPNDQQKRSPRVYHAEPVLSPTSEEIDKMYQQGIEALCIAQDKTAVIVNHRKSVELVVCDPNGLLEVARGQPGASIEKLLVGSLVPAVVVHLQRMVKLDQRHVQSKEVPCIDNHGRELAVDIDIHRLNPNESEERWLMTFRPGAVVDSATSATKPGSIDYDSEEAAIEVSGLKSALDETQKTLYDTVRELEMSNEEQKDAFEQLTAANEELQSTNEELQSVNEELYTVNFEYQSKIHELSDLTNDMNNLMRCSDIGIVFVDSNLCIRRFTDQAIKIANLNETDVGRPVSDISNELRFPDLKDLVSRVISLNQSEEIDIDYKGCAGRLHLGLYPYTVESEFCQGAVITMIDLAQHTPIVRTNTEQEADDNPVEAVE